MKHLFIINPISGGKKHDWTKTRDTIEALMSQRSDIYEIYVTKAPMDAVQKIREEAKSGEELRVYACGGDGTLNECANGAALLKNVSVTHYPCGTGNDFVRMFGDEAPMFSDLASLVDGTVHPIDLIDCGERYGLNICSVGIDARIGNDVHKYSSLPVIGGAGGYIVSAVVNVFKGINQKLTVKADGKTYEGSFSLVCACNGRFYGGGFNPMPDARPDDGLIDFLIIDKVNIFQLASLIGKYSKGRFRELGDKVKYVRTTSVEISSPKDILVGLDGEALISKTVTFRSVPGGINMIFPAGMKFFDYADVKETAGA